MRGRVVLYIARYDDGHATPICRRTDWPDDPHVPSVGDPIDLEDDGLFRVDEVNRGPHDGWPVTVFLEVVV